MLSFNEAKEIAYKKNNRFNRCNEYKNAFHFFIDEGVYTEGDNGVVVLKKDGRCINWINFIIGYKPEKNPIKIDM